MNTETAKRTETKEVRETKAQRTERIVAMLYAEGLEKSWWGDRIIRASRRGYFTRLEQVKSANWQTCACGQQALPIELRAGSRFEDEPADEILQDLGKRFWRAVEGERMSAAAVLLISIEKRAAELISRLKEAS